MPRFTSCSNAMLTRPWCPVNFHGRQWTPVRWNCSCTINIRMYRIGRPRRESREAGFLKMAGRRSSQAPSVLAKEYTNSVDVQNTGMWQRTIRTISRAFDPSDDSLISLSDYLHQALLLQLPDNLLELARSHTNTALSFQGLVRVCPPDAS